GQLYLARDVRSEPDYIRASDALVLSSLLIPMKASGKVIGIMAFDSLGLDAFSEADIAALTTLTDQMTIAAENARLYAEAQRERRRIAAILRSTRDVVLLIGPASLVQLMNPAAERVLGISAAEGSGQPIERVINELPVREAYQWLSNRSPDDDSPPREVTLGSAIYLVTLTTAKDEAGQFFGRVLVMQDITHLKQLDQFRTQMIQMASHDLRNPLSVAMGYLELLSNDLTPLTPLRRQVLAGLEHALTRMQSLITDLLDMERIEAGADRRREAVSIERLTTDVIDELREQAAAKHQHLDVSIAPALPSVTGDPVGLKQALVNLIGNAIKYTPDRGQIWVRVHSIDQQLVFEVQDTGYGISKAAQTKLFQRFFRARTRGTEHIDGTGLGLSLVKAVIEQHGGRISVESEEGKGSTFRVELPVTGNQ
ncbi:MAG TPA: ATP-binding protein, partial [Anaerolineae bacterium]|nr:ATP-binding protein [Anaerolineae bacterium]